MAPKSELSETGPHASWPGIRYSLYGSTGVHSCIRRYPIGTLPRPALLATGCFSEARAFDKDAACGGGPSGDLMVNTARTHQRWCQPKQAMYSCRLRSLGGYRWQRCGRGQTAPHACCLIRLPLEALWSRFDADGG